MTNEQNEKMVDFFTDIDDARAVIAEALDKQRIGSVEGFVALSTILIQLEADMDVELVNLAKGITEECSKLITSLSGVLH